MQVRIARISNETASEIANLAPYGHRVISLVAT